MPFTVELGIEKYRIVGPNGEEGPETDFDDVATLKIGSEIYYCDVEFDPTNTFALDEQVVECITHSRCQDGTGGTETTQTSQVLFEGEVPADDEEDEEEEDSPGPQLVS
jgi:hypothetical protein